MKTLTEDERLALEDKAFGIRKLCLEFITHAGWGHIGGSLSEAELLACLYDRVLHVDPANPQEPDRDRFILSKAHASPALYAVLALNGFFPIDRLFTYCRIGGLDGHTQRGNAPGIEYSGGSLGTGLSYAAGLASALRRREQFFPRVYCLIGDGETNEGQIWEAAAFASHYRVDNLIAIVDYNKVMAKGKMSEMIGMEPMEEKFASFGWSVHSIDGHDVSEICDALHRARYLEMKGRPVALIAHTVKGRGVEDCEFNYQWHTHAPSPAKAAQFLERLKHNYGKPDAAFLRAPSCEPDGGIKAIVQEVE